MLAEHCRDCGVQNANGVFLNMFALKGMMLLDIASQEDADACRKRLAASLLERFSEVRMTNGTLIARTHGTDVVLRGPRTHPMLPFDAGHFCLTWKDSRSELEYELSRTYHLVFFALLTLGAGLSASLDAGLLRGMVIGGVFAATWLILNTIITTVRARRWIANIVCNR